MLNKAVTISIDDSVFRGQLSPPSQLIPEKDKTASWHFKNLQYILSFYNQPNGGLNFANATTTSSGNSRSPGDMSQRLYPVQFMIRMMQYYLGQQPNLNNAWLTQDVQQSNMQAQWIRGQDVSEFVNYFRGIILNKISNAHFSAKPLSKDATSKRTDIYNQLMLKFDMQPFFKQMEALGVNFNPAQTPEFEYPEEVQKWMDTNFKEFGAILATDMANGLWFSNHWLHKFLKEFMYVSITGMCAMEHYVENGRNLQKVIMPYQLIWDNRVDDDYGRYDGFIGKVDNMTPSEIFSRFPELDETQRLDIEQMSRSNDLGQPFNNAKNLNWWIYDPINSRNTVTVVTGYWRGRHYLNKKKEDNKYKNPKLSKAKKEEDIDPNYSFDDIYKCALIGNKYLVNWGLHDNIVEEFGDKSKPLFPITRFMPNTFMGESVSEVARIHKVQDEMDMYDFKIREMIGKAKGKLYIVNGSKFDEATTPKEFLDDLDSMGVHVSRGSTGEVGDKTDASKTVEVIDWTLDPNIGQLAALYKEKKDRMGKILSASPVSMGQQTSYIGLGTQQNTISQNNLGISYMVDGFMDWIVMNMRYAVNQAKNLYTIDDNKEVSFVVGDRGMVYLKFTKDIRFEDFFIELNINDAIDEATRQRTLSYAQAWSQNPEWGISPLEILKLDRSNSSTEALEELEYSLKKGQRDKAKQAKVESQIQTQKEQEAIFMKASFEQLKQSNENWRTQYKTDMDALMNHMDNIVKSLPQRPSASPLEKQMA